MSEPGRVYGGRSESERRAERRARLLGAGLELFGTEGWGPTTIERLCTGAGVATRSFYEEFASREALLLAVFELVMGGVVAEVTPRVTAQRDPEAQVRAALSGYVAYLTEDPRRARVVHHEVRVAGTLERERHDMTVRFADLIGQTGRLPRTERNRTLGIALAGAVSEVLVEWVEQPEPRPDTGPIVEVLVELYLGAIRGAVSSPDAAGPSAG
ncbi:MAG TPA: TetR/AcrR family transcriptional regulator [Mycobacteriales bacterium]|nr:TetR/AcrR family transcriptional regulator [Mycobacteriales bacterium]